jgi:hypothetical protein
MENTDLKTPQYGEVLAPTEDRIPDPACGSGGMFVQTAHYIEKHKAQGKQMNLRAYGVEKTGILYIMGDVLRILVRFKITGHGIVYTVKITPFADNIMRK